MTKRIEKVEGYRCPECGTLTPYGLRCIGPPDDEHEELQPEKVTLYAPEPFERAKALVFKADVLGAALEDLLAWKAEDGEAKRFELEMEAHGHLKDYYKLRGKEK